MDGYGLLCGGDASDPGAWESLDIGVTTWVVVFNGVPDYPDAEGPDNLRALRRERANRKQLARVALTKKKGGVAKQRGTRVQPRRAPTMCHKGRD